MHMKIIVFLALLWSGVVNAAAPSLTVTPSRTSCTAPCSVFFDGTSTTGVTIHNGYFEHSFGDSQAGSWTRGANTSQSKNYATGIMAAHVYENVGTYTTTHRACNSSGECSSPDVTNTITVAAANTTWAANTICIANVLPVAGAGSCPSGATVLASSDFDAAIATALGVNGCGTGVACRRILFKGGDTFTVDATTTLSASTGMIGVYGSGNAIVSLGSTSFENGVIGFSGGGSDWRIVGINFVGDNSVGQLVIQGGNAAGYSNVLLMNLNITGAVKPIQTESVNGWDLWTVYQVVTSGFRADNYGLFVNNKRFAILGSEFDNNTVGSNPIRAAWLQKAVITNSNFLNPKLDREAIQISNEAAPTGETGVPNLIYLADNKVIGGPNGANYAFQLESTSTNILAERNWVTSYGNGGAAFAVESELTTVRNNLVNMPINGDVICFLFGAGAADIFVDNNTCNATTTGKITGILISHISVGPLTGRNNLFYGANAATKDAEDNAVGASGITFSTNSSDVQTGENPQFASSSPANPIDFRIGTSSYAATGGTAVFPASNSDFFNCDDTTANEHIGAFVPRVRASCKGVAQ